MFTCCCLISVQHRYFRFSFIFISHCLNFHFIREQWFLNTTTGCCERDSLFGILLPSPHLLWLALQEKELIFLTMHWHHFYFHSIIYILCFSFTFLFLFFPGKCIPKCYNLSFWRWKERRKMRTSIFSFTLPVVSSPRLPGTPSSTPSDVYLLS